MMKVLLMAGVAMISAPVMAQQAKTSHHTEANTGATTTTPAAQKGMETGRSQADAAAQTSTPTTAAPQSSAPQASASTTDGSATAGAPAADDATQPPQAASAAPAAAGQPAQSAAAQPAGQPATTGDQVASIVNQEFPTYDRDSTASLSKEEFGSWMVALRSASDPAANAASAEMKTWVAQAFTSADQDKNGVVSKDELTGFLSQGKS